MADPPGVSLKSPRWRTAITNVVAVLVLAAVIGPAIALYMRRHTYKVVLPRGERAEVVITVPFDKPGQFKGFARKRNLPVAVEIRGAPVLPDGIEVGVPATGHRVAEMWARLSVRAGFDAAPGRHERDVEFTIAGERGWPEAKLVVVVE